MITVASARGAFAELSHGTSFASQGALLQRQSSMGTWPRVSPRGMREPTARASWTNSRWSAGWNASKTLTNWRPTSIPEAKSADQRRPNRVENPTCAGEVRRPVNPHGTPGRQASPRSGSSSLQGPRNALRVQQSHRPVHQGTRREAFPQRMWKPCSNIARTDGDILELRADIESLPDDPLAPRSGTVESNSSNKP